MLERCSSLAAAVAIRARSALRERSGPGRARSPRHSRNRARTRRTTRRCGGCPAVREHVEEREPPPRFRVAVGHRRVRLGKAAAAIRDLPPHVRVGDGNGEADARAFPPRAVLDRVREELADEQPDGKRARPCEIKGLEPVDERARLADRRLGRGRYSSSVAPSDPAAIRSPYPRRTICTGEFV